MKVMINLILFLTNSIVTVALATTATATATAATTASVAVETYDVPTFTSCEINSGNQDEKIEQILTSTGLLAIRIPTTPKNEDNGSGGFGVSVSGNHDNKIKNSNNSQSLLQGLCHCKPQNMANIPNGDSRILADGKTRRSTIATASRGSTPLSLPQNDIEQYCGHGVYESLEKMRDYVSIAASETFIPALDRIIQHKQYEEFEQSESVYYHRRYHHDSKDDYEPSVTSTTAAASIASRQLGQRQLLSTTDKGKSGYSTIESIFEDSNHLEHFHLYSKDSSDGDDDDDDDENDSDLKAKVIDNALDWHTDGGLFLAFIPGQHCHNSNDENYNDDDEEGSFRVAIPDRNNLRKIKEMKAVFPNSSENEIVIAIMLGAGAEHWLNTPKSLKLKATKHAVKMKGGDFRAWYGMMHLVPTKAIIQHSPTPRTFGEMKQSSVHSLSRTFGDDDSNSSQKDVVIGCGNDDTSFFNKNSSRSYRRLEHVAGQSACDGSGNYFCWLSCLSPPDNDNDSHLNNGESLYCLDPSVLDATGDLKEAVKKCSDPVSNKAGGVMDEACQNQWHQTTEGVKSYLSSDDQDSKNNSDIDAKYCYGATAMYMQGFEWEGTTCVAYLFSSWVISTRLALILACIGTMLLAILTEIVTSRRRAFLRRPFGSIKTKLGVSALLYGVQVTLGYVVMLLIMTYSGPLVVSVIIGLVIGHIVTNLNVKSSDEIELGGSTPCCQYEGDRNHEENDTRLHSETKEEHERSSGSYLSETLGDCCRDDSSDQNLTV